MHAREYGRASGHGAISSMAKGARPVMPYRAVVMNRWRDRRLFANVRADF